MITANVFLQIIPPEELKQYVPYVMPAAMLAFFGLFLVRRRILVRRFSKLLVRAPIKPHHYNRNYLIKATNAGVFFGAELFGIFVIAVSIFVIGYGTGDDNFEKLQVWEYLSSFAVFPFLGQIMPILLKWDEQHHKESQEKAGLYYESFY